MRIFAIDPGPEYSGYCQVEFFDGSLRIESAGKISNTELAHRIETHKSEIDRLVFEWVQSFGMPVGASIFTTCFQMGWLAKAYGKVNIVTDSITRTQIKGHLCGSARAKDSGVRAALIERLGEPGRKAEPGPTCGIKADAWSALAVAVVWIEKHFEILIDRREITIEGMRP